jgi:hypothetical protein
MGGMRGSPGQWLGYSGGGWGYPYWFLPIGAYVYENSMLCNKDSDCGDYAFCKNGNCIY